MRRQLQLLQVEQEITVAKELTRLQGSSSSTSSVKSRFPHIDINPSQNQPAKASRQPRDPPAFVPYNKTNTEQAASNNHDSIRDLARILRQTPSLPKIDFMKFSGDPAQFAEFYTNFNSNIEAYVENDSERLTRLISSCSGKAAEAIRSCVSLPRDIQYKSAWETLKENFGQPHMVFEAQVARLRTHHLKRADAEHLLEFYRRLQEAERVLSSLGPEYTDRLNNDDLIKSLVKKLPEESLKRRWVDKVGDLLTKKTRIEFQDFVEFIRRQGQTLNNTYGDELMKPKPSYTSKVMTTRYRPACSHCSGQHPIWSCDSFQRLEARERLKTVYKLKLCKRCLKGNHFQTECRSKMNCKTCGKLHNSLLHINDIRNQRASTFSNKFHSQSLQGSICRSH